MIWICCSVFQSTLPRRERRTERAHLAWAADVSIHAPTKGATFHLLSFLKKSLSFNPRSHEGSDAENVIILSYICLFQSTLPRRERRSSRCMSRINSTFQSTLPRRERLAERKFFLSPYYVSIHAPTKGATMTKEQIEKMLDVSIHAPTKGATL